MKKYLSCLLFISALTPTLSAQLAYRLDMKPSVMHVDLTYKPIMADSTTFKYGDLYYGGMKDLMKGLVKLSSSVKFSVDSTERNITFYHPDNTPIQIKYDIIDTHTAIQKVRGEMFRPIMTDHYFFSLSHSLFLNPLVPEKLKENIIMSVRIENAPAFPMYFSAAPELKPNETVELKLSDGMNGLLTGATDLHIEKREMTGIKNYVVLRINPSNSYNLSRFMNYFDAFLPAMTEFWGNLNGTHYSLVASPFLDITYHTISGTSFGEGFHVKYSGDTILANDEVLYTVSHEIMHRYIGQGCVSMGENNQWFDEGFTDYTTWYMLSKSGITPPERLQEMVKETYQKLSKNPMNKTPNHQILEHFWENHDYEKLPYNRGALLAAYIDNRILEHSKGTKTYSEFMRDLKTLGEKQKEQLTVNDFISVASAYLLKREIKTAIQKYIMEGEMIPESLLIK